MPTRVILIDFRAPLGYLRGKHTRFPCGLERPAFGGAQITDDTAARLWLVPSIGPVKVNITLDPQTFGHFRVMEGKGL